MGGELRRVCTCTCTYISYKVRLRERRFDFDFDFDFWGGVIILRNNDIRSDQISIYMSIFLIFSWL